MPREVSTPLEVSAHSPIEGVATRVVRMSDAHSHAEARAATPAELARRDFAALLFSHFAAGLGFSAFSLMPKYLMTERGLSQADIGPATMAIPLGALLFAPVTAWAMGRHRKGHIARAGAAGFAVLALVFSAAPSVSLLPLVCACIGGSVMVVFSGGSALTSEVAPPGAMARALGLHGAAGMLGHALGPLALEAIAQHVGWHATFACASLAGLTSALTPLPAGSPLPAVRSTPLHVVPLLTRLLLVSALAGVMHNALWVSHQPLVLARGGRDVASYFFGMSVGGIAMRVLFGGLPDRLGALRSARAALVGYVIATLAMTFVTPQILGALGLVHGLAHGVFYPALGALCTSSVRAEDRGHALTLLYAAFNVGAVLASFSFARVGAAFGPATVFPIACAFGLLALATLAARRRAA